MWKSEDNFGGQYSPHMDSSLRLPGLGWALSQLGRLTSPPCSIKDGVFLFVLFAHHHPFQEPSRASACLPCFSFSLMQWIAEFFSESFLNTLTSKSKNVKREFVPPQWQAYPKPKLWIFTLYPAYVPVSTALLCSQIIILTLKMTVYVWGSFVTPTLQMKWAQVTLLWSGESWVGPWVWLALVSFMFPASLRWKNSRDKPNVHY